MPRAGTKTVPPKADAMLPHDLGEEIDRERRAEWKRNHPALAAAHEFVKTGGKARLPTAADFMTAANDLRMMRSAGPIDALTAEAANEIMASRGKFKSWKTQSAGWLMRAVEETSVAAKIQADEARQELKREKTAELAILNGSNNKQK